MKYIWERKKWFDFEYDFTSGMDFSPVSAVEENRKIFINEINTLPGSLQQHLWKASGIDLPDLLEKIISSAERKFSEKKKNLTLFNSPLLN